MKYRNTSKIHRSDKKGKSGYTPISNEILQSKTLNPDQKSVWNGLQKINLGGWWGNNGQNPPSDGWWGDEPDVQNQANGQPAFNVIIEEQ